MSIRSRVLHHALAVALCTFLAPATGVGSVRITVPGPPQPPASMTISIADRWDSTPGTSGWNSSDTLLIHATVHFLSPCEAWRGEWRVTLPEGLEHVSGQLEGSGLTAQIRGVHEIRARRTRWGAFQIRGSFRTGVDSLNWTSHDNLLEMQATIDSFFVANRPAHHYGILNRVHMLGGVRHRKVHWSGGTWLPLDPGEDEAIEPGFYEHMFKSPLPAMHKESGRFAGASASDSTIHLTVLVAVNRAGLVKDVYTYPAPITPRPILDSAVVAARKWRFEPAISLGRPVSALYSIKVPVQVPADVYADLRKRNRLP